jgi:hypothetical protein
MIAASQANQSPVELSLSHCNHLSDTTLNILPVKLHLTSCLESVISKYFNQGLISLLTKSHKKSLTKFINSTHTRVALSVKNLILLVALPYHGFSDNNSATILSAQKLVLPCFLEVRYILNLLHHNINLIDGLVIVIYSHTLALSKCVYQYHLLLSHIL